ncbi:hypothetical protein M1N79_03205 [Dehalococcoidia bacterium]|nr:hypothetical protein [Dehalococcoidia bacterium]
MLEKIINRIHRNERGVTGLETAIILIAFVVVASVFAYTVLSAGLFSAQQADETVRSGIRTTQTTMKLRGAVHAFADNATTTFVERISFTVSNVLGEGQAIDLTPSHNVTGGELVSVGNVTSVTIISFDDAYTVIPNVAWTVEIVGGFEDDADFLLEDVERATITVWLEDYHGLSTNAIFNLQVMPPQGATLQIQQRTPPHLGDIMRL